MSAAPSSRFMPIQSQPTASGCISWSLHSWSSQARPLHRHRPAGAPQRALRRQLRFAQVVAGLGFVRALAREAGVALQQQRLGGAQLQLQLEAVGGAAEAGAVQAEAGVVAALQRPAAQPQVGVAVEARASAASGSPDQRAIRCACWCVPAARSVNAAWANSRWRAAKRLSRPAASPVRLRKKVIWKPRRRSPGGAQLAGQVPPFDGRAEVRAMVARKAQRAAAAHRSSRRRASRGSGQAQRPAAPRAGRRGGASYQSSLTDSSAAREAAARAL